MALPFSVDYLSAALKPEIALKQGKLVHREIGRLELPTGELVACDPFVFLDAKPFQTKLPIGTFPVILSIEDTGNDQRVAFATVRFTLETPVQWEMMLVGQSECHGFERERNLWLPSRFGDGMLHGSYRCGGPRPEDEGESGVL